MTTKYKIGAFLALILLVGVVFSSPQAVKALSFLLRSGANVPTGTFALQTSTSTSTPNFLQNGKGTTTLTFESQDLDSVTLYIRAFASSTNRQSPLSIERQASDDNIEWFTYDDTLKRPDVYLAATTSIALASTTVPITWQPSSVGATTTKVFDINLMPARYTRLIFTLASSSAVTVNDGMNIWANIVGKIGVFR